MAHRLDPLLQPASLALVGATTRPDSPGRDMLLTLRRGGFAGRAYAVNPKYAEVEGYPCFPSLAALPEAVDLAVLSLANAGLERALAETIAAGARAALIFASGQLPDDPALPRRLAAMAREAGLPLCGVNCMGFYNDEAAVWACGFPSQRQRNPGGIAWIAQSGSVFGALAHNDPRFRFNLAISPGAESVTTAADYLDYALSRPSTRVVGLFLESVRDPEGFVAALRTAEARRIPVVVLKVGRTEEARALALSHTGALAGDDAAFEALCDRHGVHRVATLDELAATLLLFSAGRPAAAGGLATLHDSGGEREMLVDLAAGLGVPFARLAPATLQKLGGLLEPGLEPHNPLDAWGTGAGFVESFGDCLTALADDPDTAAAVLFADVRDGFYVSEGFATAALATAQRTAKPVALATNFSGVRHDAMARRVTEAGVPVLDGTEPALKALRHLLAHRDHRPRPAPPPLPALAERWRRRLLEGTPLSEAESLALCAEHGLPVAPHALVADEAAAQAAFARLGPRVALKSAAPGLLHKSDADGVRLGLAEPAAVSVAYRDLSRRLGPQVLIQTMAPAGAEFILGARFDPQFGPLVVLGAGGILVELLADSAAALAPFDETEVSSLLARLRAARLLEGLRGRPPLDRGALVACVVAFSRLAATLGPLAREIDVNPLIVHPGGCVAVDALVVPAADRS